MSLPEKDHAIWKLLMLCVVCGTILGSAGNLKDLSEMKEIAIILTGLGAVKGLSQLGS